MIQEFGRVPMQPLAIPQVCPHSRPPWLPPKSSALRWAWVEGDGPLITNGLLRESQLNSSETDSDSVTVTMFSLDMFCKLKFDFLL